MELLLLLSALLSGITGVMGGGREAEGPQVEISAALQAAEVAAAQVAEVAMQQRAAAFAVVLMIALVLFLRPLARWRLCVPAMARYGVPKDERRRE